jgi:ADP-heptose:LPS heptosyltransferase
MAGQQQVGACAGAVDHDTATADPGLVDGVRRIAVLSCNALGDYLMAAPALEALAAAYPQAELILLGANWHTEFLTGRPGPVGRVMVLPVVPGLAGQPGAPPASGLDGFLAAARTERFDLAVQLHGGGARPNALVTALGARVTAGLRANDAPPLDRGVPYRYYQSEVARYLEVVSLLGATAPPDPPELAVTPEEDRAAAELLADAADDGGPWVGLHPGATDPRRRWPVSRFADVGARARYRRRPPHGRWCAGRCRHRQGARFGRFPSGSAWRPSEFRSRRTR